MVPIELVLSLSEHPLTLGLGTYPVQPRTQAELVTSRESWVLSETEATAYQKQQCKGCTRDRYSGTFSLHCRELVLGDDDNGGSSEIARVPWYEPDRALPVW